MFSPIIFSYVRIIVYHVLATHTKILRYIPIAPLGVDQ